ncbi:hypothetical protein [Janthinobacterium sp. UMAB-56]|uniref:hypothetical protein n=1 Tax=Janthinobacterium sp. UMAB-56 TaxID=1365361 RepID=UPI001C57CB6B|nr:hypothetical protein [Janthinobacterium sp. UMAB-56]
MSQPNYRAITRRQPASWFDKAMAIIAVAAFFALLAWTEISDNAANARDREFIAELARQAAQPDRWPLIEQAPAK